MMDAEHVYVAAATNSKTPRCHCHGWLVMAHGFGEWPEARKAGKASLFGVGLGPGVVGGGNVVSSTRHIG